MEYLLLIYHTEKEYEKLPTVRENRCTRNTAN
jgi:hypothetical protein